MYVVSERVEISLADRDGETNNRMDAPAVDNTEEYKCTDEKENCLVWVHNLHFIASPLEPENTRLDNLTETSLPACLFHTPIYTFGAQIPMGKGTAGCTEMRWRGEARAPHAHLRCSRERAPAAYIDCIVQLRDNKP
ncbi:unnamed protein product [Arctia plantaginis]|uniref:Uncharacterized protein n=1 Tax=Arctia plantaginis TaxID=874455 RepID=A0A8S1B1H3_ARCPL|nr:unnamed protein product [Arctia plantaginis]